MKYQNIKHKRKIWQAANLCLIEIFSLVTILKIISTKNSNPCFILLILYYNIYLTYVYLCISENQQLYFHTKIPTSATILAIIF